MKFIQEPFTVLPDVNQREIAVLVAGMRISFTVDEARRLTTELSKVLPAIGGEGRKTTHGTGSGLSDNVLTELRTAKDDLKTVG